MRGRILRPSRVEDVLVQQRGSPPRCIVPRVPARPALRLRSCLRWRLIGVGLKGGNGDALREDARDHRDGPGGDLGNWNLALNADLAHAGDVPIGPEELLVVDHVGAEETWG
jgi:hypothetical protein